MAPTDADDLIASDPPPAFPPWMVAADPRLAAQDTNALYVALRRRRLLYPRARTWADWRRQQRGVPPWAVLGAFFGALLAVAMPLVAVMGALVVVPLAAILMGGLHFIAPLFNARERLIEVGHSGRLAASWFKALRQPQSPDSDRALFLAWSVGARGRDVLEAVYLDVRERDLRAATLATAGLGIVAPLVVLAISLAEVLPPAMAPWSLTLVLLAAAAARILWAMMAHARPVGALAERVRGWQSMLPPDLARLHPPIMLLPSETRTQWQRLLRSLALMSAVVALAAVVIAVVVAVDSATGAATASVMAAALVLAAPRLVRWQCRFDEHCIQALLDQADHSFEYVVGLIITGERADEGRALAARFEAAKAASTSETASDEEQPATTTTPDERPDD